MISSTVLGNLKKVGFTNVKAYDKKGVIASVVDGDSLYIKVGKHPYKSIPLDFNATGYVNDVAVSLHGLIAVAYTRGIEVYDVDFNLINKHVIESPSDDQFYYKKVEWVYDVLIAAHIIDDVRGLLVSLQVDRGVFVDLGAYISSVDGDGLGADMKFHMDSEVLYVGAPLTDTPTGLVCKTSAGGRVHAFSVVDGKFKYEDYYIDAPTPTSGGMFGRDIRLCPEGILIEGYSNGYSSLKGQLRVNNRYKSYRDDDGRPVLELLKSFNEK